jgi:endonuclease/exonuclease/phosphatase family metal-dependent hydrolase
VALVSAVLLAGCRAALLATDGGQPQLYVASVGLLAGLAWLAASAAVTADPLPGAVFGLVLGTLAHAAVDTFDLTWRGGFAGWSVVAATAGVFLFAQWSSPAADPSPAGGAAAWFLLGPVLLLWGMLAGSPALATVAISYAYGDFPGVADAGPVGVLPVAALVAVSSGLFVAAAFLGGPRRLTVPVGAIALLAATVAFIRVDGSLLWPAIPLAALGLGLLWNASTGTAPASSPSRRGFAVVGGTVVFAVAAVLYYASYDLGYPNGWVPVAIGVLLAAVAARRLSAAPVSPIGWWAAPAAVTAVATLAAAAIAPVTVRAAEPAAEPAQPGRLRVVAYNIRMGFGLDGRFDLDGLAGVVAGQRPDVVLLSEVDRAWLLNGGHDTVALLARRLGMPYRFAPAADAVWGDAVLTRLPVVDARTVRLSAVGAPTGAQALGVVVRAADREVAVVSTHLQPPPDGGPVVQAREVASFARSFAAGRPLVVGGDMNTRPGDPAFQELLGAGVVDALAAARPLNTSPADAPDEQIDHLLVSPGVAVSDVVAPPGTASDHLAVAATFAFS